MEKIVKQGYLYDFYGELLTEHQRQIYEGVVYENLSLAEIAKEQGISRQGVHDIIKRCDKSLLEYEDKLKLVDRFLHMRQQIAEIERLSTEYEEDTQAKKEEYCCKIRKISTAMLDEL